MVGHEALDEIITPLLEKLTPEKEDVLAGLCEIMKQNSRFVEGLLTTLSVIV